LPKPAPGDIVVISGPPGAGKSSTARELLKLIDAPVSYIEGDVFWSFFTKTTGRSRASNATALIRAVMFSAIAFSRSGYKVIVDFTIGPWHFDLFKKYLREASMHYVVICPDEQTCANRAAAHADATNRDYAAFHEIHEAFRNLGDFEENTIRDASAKSPELAARIHQNLLLGTYRV
jgi:chloramphenicol 3-O-phosphotransferase